VANRAPITTEDTSGAPAPLEPGSLVAGPTPGYWRFAVVALSGVSTWGASFVAAANAAAAKVFLALTKSDVGLSNVDNTSDVNKPVSTAQNAADLLRALKTGDNFSGAVGVTAPTGTALTVTSTDGVGELALKIRTAAATSTSAQAGVDYGFNNLYRITQAVAGAGIGAPFGGAAYTYCSGVPYRFITDHVLNGIEFWAGSIYAARVYNGTVQCGAVPSGGSTIGIPLYCGKNAATVQLRVGDLSGNCWSIGRDNISTGDLIIEPTAPAGTTPYASALRVLAASGVVRATFGAQIGSGGTTLTQAKVYTPTLTPAATVGAGYWEQTFTVTGLSTSDTVTVNGPAAAASTVLVHARVSAANTLALTWITSGAATPATGVYRILAVRS